MDINTAPVAQVSAANPNGDCAATEWPMPEPRLWSVTATAPDGQKVTAIEEHACGADAVDAHLELGHVGVVARRASNVNPAFAQALDIASGDAARRAAEKLNTAKSERFHTANDRRALDMQIDANPGQWL